MAFLMTVYISVFEGRVGSWVPMVMAFLAASSAASFPGIPTCNGTQSICTSRLFIFALSSKERIFIVISGRILKFLILLPVLR